MVELPYRFKTGFCSSKNLVNFMLGETQKILLYEVSFDPGKIRLNIKKLENSKTEILRF